MKKPTVVTSDITGAIRPPRCPQCGAAIEMQATIEAWPKPHGWHFYGYEGQRWIKCRGEHAGHIFVHFIVLVNRRLTHRVAWINAPVEATGEQARLL